MTRPPGRRLLWALHPTRPIATSEEALWVIRAASVLLMPLTLYATWNVAREAGLYLRGGPATWTTFWWSLLALCSAFFGLRLLSIGDAIRAGAPQFREPYPPELGGPPRPRGDEP